MASITTLNISGTPYTLNDARVSTSAVTTATHLLATNAGVTAINPITAANLASVLGALLCIKKFELAPGSISLDLKNVPVTIYVCGKDAGIIYGAKLEFNGSTINSEVNTSIKISYSLSTASVTSKVLTIENSGQSIYNVIVVGFAHVSVTS